MTKEKTLLIIAAVLVVAIIVVVIIFWGPRKEAPPEEEPAPVIADEIHGLSGKIKDIKENALIIEAKILLKDPSKEPIKQEMKVLTDEETKIIKLEFPDPEDIPEGSTEPIFPKETEISFNDLSIGNEVDIEAKDNIAENIKNKTEFTAKIINVLD